MKKHPKLNTSQCSELSSFISSTEDAREARRAQAVIFIDQGKTIEMITLLTALKRRQISRTCLERGEVKSNTQ